MPSSFKDLMKTDRRRQWKILKEKHAKIIAKSKVDFNLKLGPALDKYQTQVEKLTQLAAKTELKSMQVQPVLETLEPLQKIVAAYHDAVKALEEPAKKEMTALLAAITDDIHSWEQLAVNTMGTPSKGSSDAEKAAASAITITLDNIRAMCLTMITRGPRAKAAYEKNKPNARLKAAALAGQLIESSRLAGSAAHELANAASQVSAGKNYELFKARAKAAEGLFQKARDACQLFHDKWDINLGGDGTMFGDIDAKALKENHDQMVSDLGHALALIQKLP